VAVSRNRYGVEKTVDTHTILINAIKCYPPFFFLFKSMINNIPESKQMNKYNIDFFYMHLFTMQCQCVSFIINDTILYPLGGGDDENLK
jgi:hypothetical protein